MVRRRSSSIILELSTIVQPISDIAELLVEVLKARIKQTDRTAQADAIKLPVTFNKAQLDF